ncbi:MAG: T9SS type A sorting domain-containing protein [Ignavibacteria bacterium]|nr:T9SS type A sorting domain-containing protein [Ignavibacteria bacterium]
MKNYLSVFVILSGFLLFQNSYSQNPNWITPGKTYLKMYVVQDAMYRVDKSDFTNAGIDVSSIDPRTVKIYNKGNQVPVYFSGESDGTFDKGDFLDFYGERNYGGNTKFYDEIGSYQYTLYEYYGIYSDTNIYLVDWGGTQGLRYEDFTYSTGTDYSSSNFNEMLHFEKDSVFSLGQQINANDYRRFSVDNFMGEDWYWRYLTPYYDVTQSVNTPKLDASASTFNLRVTGYPAARSTSLFNEHNVQIIINGTVITTVVANDFNRMDTTVTLPVSLLSSSANNQIKLFYFPSGALNLQFYLDYFEITYPRIFTLDGSALKMNLPLGDSTSKRFTINSVNTSAPVNIYDIRNNLRITNNAFNAGNLQFTAKSNSKLEIINADITQKPFRIKQKSVPNLVSNLTGADYIIVYNRMFESQAEAIRSYRQSNDGMRSFKAEIEDLYDVYNYGLENPSAVRLFLKTAYENWTAPKMKYVCLFGRGSLDPKNNQARTPGNFYGNVVPVYGNPNSDNYFATFNLNSTIYYPTIAVGRLPAYTTAEAEIMKNKILNYNSQPLDDWVKRFILVTGGVTQSEQNYFQSICNSYSSTYLTPKPISALVDKIYRIDGQGSTTYNFQDSIINDFNRGATIINYSGHAGNGTWDQGLEDPNLLSNGYKLPLLFSMTCFTAKNSDPGARGFGEKFFMYDNKGAIGYVGCTGWAFTSATDLLTKYMFAGIKDSAFRRQGDLLRAAETIMKNDSATFSTRISLECFNFLGDPAQRLNLPSYPEFSIKDNDYTISDPAPVIGQNVKITAYPKNFGTGADSMKIKFQILKNNASYKTRDTVVKNFNFKDSASYSFTLDTLGIYFVRISLDPDNWYTQEDPNNNIITIPVNLKNNSFIPLKPVSGSIVNTDTVYFTCLNPDSDPAVNTVQLTLQLDTNNSFTNPITFINNSPGGVYSKFQTAVPLKDSTITYYWRTNASINGNVSGWSQTQTFSYSTRVFSASPFVKTSLIADSSIIVYLKSKNQYNEPNFNNVSYQSGGISIPQSSGFMRCYSLGNNGEESSYFIVNISQINIGQGLNPGLNILRVRRTDMKIQELKNFRFNSASSADSVATYLNGLDSSSYIMVVKALVTTSNSMNTACKNAFRQFGSVYADSTPGFNQFWTWSFIGYKGANSSQISEEFHRNNSANSCLNNWCPSNSTLNVKYLKTFGTAIVNLGPAQNWKKFSWEQIVGTGNAISADVYGVKKDNSTSLLYSNVTSFAGLSLDTLNSYTYPNLNVLFKLSVDTLNAAPSPVVKSVTAQYNPPYEVVVNKPTFHCKDSVVKLLQKVKIDFRFVNTGYRDISKFYVNWFYYPFSPGRKVIKADTISALVQVDSSYKVTQDIIIPRDNSPLAAPTSVTIYAEVYPYGQSNEFYSYNNTGQITFRIISTPILPVADVYFDGAIVKNGDFVRKNPDVKIRVNNLSALQTIDDNGDNSEGGKLSKNISSDSSNVRIYLNNQYLPYNGSSQNHIQKSKGFNDAQADNIELNFAPNLNIGNNQLTIFITDNSGEKLDSITYDVVVSNELFVKDFYNYPNPISRETSFIFNIAGAMIPHSGKIKIYTVSGRLVKEIITPLNVGYNQIPWDARDNDGDFIANGVYLYKLVVEDDIKTETAIQKLVVLK